MIRHICMFKLKEDRAANTAEFVRRADSLRVIGEIRRFEVVTNVDGTPDGNFDVSLIFDFDSLAALDAYQTNPVHLEFAKFVASVREARACIDCEV